MGNISAAPVLVRNKTPEGREAQVAKLSDDEISHLKKQFEELDTDDSGDVSIAELRTVRSR